MKIRKTTYLTLSAVILAAIILIAVSMKDRDVPKRYPTSGSTIVAFGDSLVEGVGASAGNDLVSILSRDIGEEIINAGRSGDTTAAALERLERDALDRDPRVVIVLLGGNDALRRIPRDETERNLATIIDSIQDRGAAVILVGVRAGLFTDEYKKMYRNLASKKGTHYIPNILDGVFGDPRLMSDTIHPNDVGYAIMAERIEPLLLEVMTYSK